MKTTTPLIVFVAAFSLLSSAWGFPFPPSGGNEIVERGQDHALFRKVSHILNPQGDIVLVTNQFTLLENGLHFFDQA